MIAAVGVVACAACCAAPALVAARRPTDVLEPRRLAALLLVIATGLLVVGLASETGEGEKLLGLDLESTAPIVAAVVVSVAVAVGLWATRWRVVVLLAVPVAFVFGVVDLAEVAHQVDESNLALAGLAAVVAAAHLAAAVAAATSLSSGD